MNSPAPDPLRDQTNSLPPRPLGPGGRLARARREKGVTLDVIVGFLKYSPRQIEALEADHYEGLPPPSVVRGMVRGYAKFLGIDPEPLLEELRLILIGPPPEVTAQVMDVPFQNKRGAAHWVWWLVPGLVAVALIAFGVEYFLREGGQFRAHMPEVTRSSSTVGAAGPAAADVPRSREEQGIGAAVTGGQGESVTAGSSNPAGVALSAPAMSPTDHAGPTGGAASPRSPTRHIQMHFDKASWVEVRSGDGQILVSQVLDAGTDKVIEGRPPFTLVIGAAHGVALRYEGEPVNLAPYTVVDVARLSLY